jgi:riboflavin kinase / FMN adenylyltransferase
VVRGDLTGETRAAHNPRYRLLGTAGDHIAATDTVSDNRQCGPTNHPANVSRICDQRCWGFPLNTNQPQSVKLYRDIGALPADVRAGAVAIGNFDGVHLGHARIIERLIARAREVAGPAVVFTFDPHPVRLLRPAFAPPPLTWTNRKAELLSKMGVDAVIAYPTDKGLLSQTPLEFFDSIVRTILDARALVEGPNFFFGHNRSGTIDVLGELARDAGVWLEVVEPVVVAGEVVSSSRVRRLIGEGHVAEARELLTAPYRIRGLVVPGAMRGSQIGFPTANLDAIDTLLPAQGVYAGRARADGRNWPAAIHIGPNPTFGEQALKVEVHLIGWEGPLYGNLLEVDFWTRLRGTQRFDGLDALQSQLKRDVAAADEAFHRHPIDGLDES